MTATRVPGGEGAETEALDVRGPLAATLFVLPITNASVAFDLTGGNYTALKAAILAGRLLTLKADGVKVYYRWAGVTGTVDETKTAADTPANQAGVLSDGERSDERADSTTTFLMVKGSVNSGYLRIHISSVSAVP